MTELAGINRRFAEEIGRTGRFQGKPPVFGEGKARRPVLMLVGEAPGVREAALGRPFVGQAGMVLEGQLRALGLHRKDIYLTNAVKIRPTRPGASGREVNRAPDAAEVALFLPWLLAEIREVDPECIATLGNIPLKALLGLRANVGAMHGRWTQGPDGRRLFPLYHPAATIYRRELIPVFARDLEVLAGSLRES